MWAFLPEEANESRHGQKGQHGQELVIKAALFTGPAGQQDTEVPLCLWTGQTQGAEVTPEVTPTGQKRKGLGIQQGFLPTAMAIGNPTETEQGRQANPKVRTQGKGRRGREKATGGSSNDSPG